jgi:hypothetical protein
MAEATESTVAKDTSHAEDMYDYVTSGDAASPGVAGPSRHVARKKRHDATTAAAATAPTFMEEVFDHTFEAVPSRTLYEVMTRMWQMAGKIRSDRPDLDDRQVRVALLNIFGDAYFAKAAVHPQLFYQVTSKDCTVAKMSFLMTMMEARAQVQEGRIDEEAAKRMVAQYKWQTDIIPVLQKQAEEAAAAAASTRKTARRQAADALLRQAEANIDESETNIDVPEADVPATVADEAPADISADIDESKATAVPEAPADINADRHAAAESESADATTLAVETATPS